MPDHDYALRVAPAVNEFLETVDQKSERICKENISYLTDNPYPGSGRGDKEGGITIDGEDVYRMHIGRTYTAFYEIDEDAKEVRVLELTTIDDAHERYGR